MTITTTDPRPSDQRSLMNTRFGAESWRWTSAGSDSAPIVVAVDNSGAAAAAAEAGVRLARSLAAPLVFVYVRRDPPSALGEPYYQRRLDAEIRAGRRAVNDALVVAEGAGVPATGEQLAGDPGRRVVEFARAPRRAVRRARLAAAAPRQERLSRGGPRRRPPGGRGRTRRAERRLKYRCACVMGVRCAANQRSHP